MKKAMESLRSGIVASMPASVICCRIYDVLEVLNKCIDNMGVGFIRETGRLDERLSNLETDIKDAADHYGDSFGEVELQFRYLETRLLQRVEHERAKRHQQVAQIDKALSGHRFGDEHKKVEERLDALEKLHYKGASPEAHNYPEPIHNEPTCGECVWPWRKEDGDIVWRKAESPACENFRRREEK